MSTDTSRLLLALACLTLGLPAQGQLSLGLGKAAAKRSVSVIDKGRAAVAASAASSTAPVTPLATAPVAATVTNMTATGLSANWTANGNPTGTMYMAQVSTDAFVTVVAASQTLNVSAGFSNLTPNTAYALRVGVLGSGNYTSLGSTTTLARLKWSLHFPETVYYASPAIASDGTIYFGTSHHYSLYASSWNISQKPTSAGYGLYAYNPNGTQKWKYSDGIDAPVRGSPVIAPDGTIYIVLERLGTSQATTSEELHAVTALGAHKWKVTISTAYSQIGTLAPSVAPDGTIYIPGRNVSAYNPDGSLKWINYGSQSSTSLFFASPAIAPDGTVYSVIWATGAAGQVLRAYNPDGSVKWNSADLGTYPLTCSPSIAGDGTIYLGIKDNNSISGQNGGALIAFWSTGTIRWAYPAGDFDVRSQPSIDADGTIYFGTKGNNGYVYALNPDGTLKWRHATVNDLVCPGCGTDVYNTPAIGADGIIYVANELAFVYAFNPDGTILWKDNTLTSNGGITQSSAALAPDGTLYIGTAYGDFMAVRTGSLGLKTTAQWPRFKYGNDSSGAKP